MKRNMEKEKKSRGVGKRAVPERSPREEGYGHVSAAPLRHLNHPPLTLFAFSSDQKCTGSKEGSRPRAGDRPGAAASRLCRALQHNPALPQFSRFNFHFKRKHFW